MRRRFQPLSERAARNAARRARLSADNARSGSIALEMLFILPVFLALLFAFIEFSTIIVVEERLATASAQGARVASQGGSVTDVYTAVNNTLVIGSALQTNLNPIIITPTDPTTAYSGAPVTVRLEVNATTVTPDLLRFIGYSIKNQMLVGQTVLRKE